MAEDIRGLLPRRQEGIELVLLLRGIRKQLGRPRGSKQVQGILCLSRCRIERNRRYELPQGNDRVDPPAAEVLISRMALAIRQLGQPRLLRIGDCD